MMQGRVRRRADPKDSWVREGVANHPRNRAPDNPSAVPTINPIRVRGPRGRALVALPVVSPVGPGALRKGSRTFKIRVA